MTFVDRVLSSSALAAGCFVGNLEGGLRREVVDWQGDTLAFLLDVLEVGLSNRVVFVVFASDRHGVRRTEWHLTLIPVVARSFGHDGEVGCLGG